VDDVVGPADRHVARNAVGGYAALRGAAPCRDAVPQRVAAEAFRGVVRRGVGRTAVRVVTGGAGHPPALQEAGGLPQPVRLMRDLELVVVAAPGGVVEMRAV